MHYHEQLPPLALQSAVRCLWVREIEPSAHPREHLFFSERATRLVFHDGQVLVGTLGGSLEPLPSVYHMGFLKTPLRAISQDSKDLVRAVGVEFYPWGAVRLLGLERVFDLPFHLHDDALERLGRQITALLRADAAREAIELLEDWLLVRARDVKLDATPASLAAMRLYEQKGQGRIADLAEELGISQRQLERGFQTQIGISAKQLAQAIRFGEAHTDLMLEPTRSLTDLAYALGYGDQSHFNREFRAFTGMSPGEFAERVVVRQHTWARFDREITERS
jgi:AraC-like DNA-binding protein